MKPYIKNELKEVQVSWDWTDKAQGLIKWTFKNPNNVPVNFVLNRGISANGSPAQNIYLFGDAFYPLYYYNFGVQFQTGQPTPLTASIIQPPLAMFKSPSDVIQAAFIFTLKAGGSWTMEEGGWVDNSEPAGISAILVNYSKTAQFTVNYNKQISCQQYNEQAGTNYPCPPDPFVVESALFLLPVDVSREVNSDVITENAPSGGNSGNSSGGGSSSTGNFTNCVTMFIRGLEGGSFREVVQGVECLLDNGVTLDDTLKLRFEKVRHLF